MLGQGNQVQQRQHYSKPLLWRANKQVGRKLGELAPAPSAERAQTQQPGRCVRCAPVWRCQGVAQEAEKKRRQRNAQGATAWY